MKNFSIDGVEIITDVDDMDEREAKVYLNKALGKVNSELVKLEIHAAESGMLDVKYICRRIKFERIRRITGYLVGTLDKWNDAKQAEEKQRVKHL